MLLMNAIALPSGDHDGCAAFAAGSGAPGGAGVGRARGSTSGSWVPGLTSRREPVGSNVENSDVYDAVVTGATVGAGFAVRIAGALRSNTAPLSPPPHSSPAR